MGCKAVYNYIERSSVLSTVTSVTVLLNGHSHMPDAVGTDDYM